jgi:hypothetical protein
VTLTFTDELTGKAAQELLDRADEARLMIENTGRAWSMNADGNLFRLVSEARRISLAYLFDPFLAVQTSTLRTLPHQIDAVYNKMLPRQPLRFLLADDPGDQGNEAKVTSPPAGPNGPGRQLTRRNERIRRISRRRCQYVNTSWTPGAVPIPEHSRFAWWPHPARNTPHVWGR